MEAAGKEANEITVQTPNCVSIIKTPSKCSTPKTLPPGPCPSCVRAKDHWRSACLHRNTVCSCCKHMSHLARVCRDRQKQQSGKTKHFYPPKNRTNVINAEKESEHCTAVLTVNSSSQSKPTLMISLSQGNLMQSTSKTWNEYLPRYRNMVSKYARRNVHLCKTLYNT